MPHLLVGTNAKIQLSKAHHMMVAKEIVHPLDVCEVEIPVTLACCFSPSWSIVAHIEYGVAQGDTKQKLGLGSPLP